MALPLAAVAAVLFGIGWVLNSPSRAGARAVRIEALADSVVAAVGRGQPAQPMRLDDFVASGVLTAGDVEFLGEQGVSFHAFHRSSPDTASVFRLVRGGTERVYRKNGQTDYYPAGRAP